MRRFFFMEADPALPDIIGFRDFNIYGSRKIFTPEEQDAIRDVTALYLDPGKGECGPDFITSPFYMVSAMAKKVLEMHEDSIRFKKIVLIHKEEERQMAYYHLLLKTLPALHEDTVYYPNGMEKQRILSLDKIGGHRAFLLEDSLRQSPVISQEIVEGLLRRKSTGIQFQEVEVR